MNVSKTDTPTGHLVIVAGPSGSGKSTLIKRYLAENPQWTFPTSVTTREPREGEVHGDHYFFVSRDDFREKMDKDEFLEWAAVYGLYYGTLKSTIMDGLKEGKSFLKDIDIQGARSLMELLPPQNLTSIFISPPSLEVLKERLQFRNSENEETLRNRLAEAQVEMEGAKEFDKIIINDDLEKAYAEFKAALHHCHS
jgi:guanylate kinase